MNVDSVVHVEFSCYNAGNVEGKGADCLRSKKWISFIFLLFTLGVVIYIGFSGNNVADLSKALLTFSPVFMSLCLLCWIVYWCADALSLCYFLQKQGFPISYWRCLYLSLTGIYYCNVTPGSSGGQPMQIYRLKQLQVPIGVGSSAVSVRFFCFQTMLLVVGAVLWIANCDFVNQQLGDTRLLIWLGYVINFISISMVLLVAINKGVVRWLVHTCISIGTKLHICKDPDASTIRWDHTLEAYHDSVCMIFAHPKELIVQCLIATFQVLIQGFVVVCLYIGFGMQGINASQLLTLAVLLYISASYMPLPGASGAQEGGFALYFQGIFPADGTLFVALMLWRFSTYYFPVILGVIMTLWENLRAFRQAKHKEAA